MLWSERCAACGDPAALLCDPCRRGLRRAVVAVPPPGLDACRALLAYQGPGRALVARLKYRNDRRALSWLVDGMAALLDVPPGAVVTWVPTTVRRRSRRGFDQARLLARGLARRWGVPCSGLLVRGDGPAQSSRTRDERHRGVPLGVRPGRPVTRPVVVVDDVTTTGASLAGAAQALRAGGCPWVGAVTAAYTPLAGDRPHDRAEARRTPAPGGRT
jgi:predicted amidophosphoribosyltransferase